MACVGGVGKCAIEAGAVPGIVSSVATVVAPGIVRRGGSGDAGWVYRAHVFLHGRPVGFVVVKGLTVRDFAGRQRFSELVGLRRDTVGVDVFEVVEFALADLFADDVDVVGVVHLLEGLGAESGQQADDYS